METSKSIEIIENMMKESKRSLMRNSFFFILWAALLVPAGLMEFFLKETNFPGLVWPVVGIIGGIISTIYGRKESSRAGVGTFGDRITAYTWGAFGFALIWSIAFSVKSQYPPHAMILLLAGLATFINGGISNFKPFIYGAVILELGAIACGFFVEPVYHSLVFSLSILIGYLIPGIQLRKIENGQAQ